MKKLLAEAIGTFALIFAGTGAMVVNDVRGGEITHVGIALTWGLTVLTLIYTLGEVSGAHFNPAVTIGFWIARRMEGARVLPYILSQCVGAIAASLALNSLFAGQPRMLGASLPTGPILQAFVFELLCTWFLMFVILNVSTGAKEKGIFAGIVVGSVIVLESLFAGPITGSSMNPARSIGPALVTLHFEHLWLYIVAPLLGSALAVLTCRCVQEEGCCTGKERCA
jgi:aquaporin NIP